MPPHRLAKAAFSAPGLGPARPAAANPFSELTGCLPETSANRFFFNFQFSAIKRKNFLINFENIYPCNPPSLASSWRLRGDSSQDEELRFELLRNAARDRKSEEKF